MIRFLETRSSSSPNLSQNGSMRTILKVINHFRWKKDLMPYLINKVLMINKKVRTLLAAFLMIKVKISSILLIIKFKKVISRSSPSKYQDKSFSMKFKHKTQVKVTGMSLMIHF